MKIINRLPEKPLSQIEIDTGISDSKLNELLLKMPYCPLCKSEMETTRKCFIQHDGLFCNNGHLFDYNGKNVQPIKYPLCLN